EYLEKHPELLKEKGLWEAVDAYKTSAREVETSPRAKYMSQARVVAPDVPKPEEAVPMRAREHTTATTRAEAWKDYKDRRRAAGEARKAAKKALGEARKEAADLRSEARSLELQAKAVARERRARKTADERRVEIKRLRKRVRLLEQRKQRWQEKVDRARKPETRERYEAKVEELG